MRNMIRQQIFCCAICIGALALPLAACNEQDTATAEQTFGPSPTLPAPEKSWIPTVNVAKAIGWPAGGKPTAANGMAVNAFATGLDHPRTVYVLPNGDVLVAETNAPPKPDDGKGIKGWITKLVMGRAGADTPSANRITLLRDADGDGVAETKSVFLEGLNSPFGMALVGNDFYVANSDAIMKFPYHAGDTKITAPGVKLADLPAGPHQPSLDQGSRRQSATASKLYATVGSNSNVGENGIEAETNRAAVLEVDRASGKWRVFASGLRNPNGPSWQPQSGALWVDGQRARRTRQRSRARLHDLGEGRRVLRLALQLLRPACRRPRRTAAARSGRQGDRAGLCARRPHRFARADLQHRQAVSARDGRRRLRRPARLVESQAARRLQGDLRAVRQRQAFGQAAGRADRFPQPDGEAQGRPVGVAIDKQGALLVADDVGNTIWRVTPAAKSAAR